MICRPIRLTFLALAAAGTILGAGCKSTSLMSKQDEIKIGEQGSTEVEKQYHLDPNPADQAMVQSIGAKLLASNKVPDYPYTFKVLDAKDINAFSLPGGPVYVFKGLMDLTEGDQDELACIIGHEMGHIVHRHVAKQYTQGFWLDLLVALGTRGSAQNIANMGAVLTQLHFSRQDELEADRSGILFAHNAGYDPNGMIRFFEKLERGEGKSNKFDEILATHPLTKDRIEKAKAEIAKVSGGTSQP